MSVTVAISVWEGHKDKLERAIESALQADEILVIDNGWTCKDIAKAWDVTYLGRDPVCTAVSVSRNIAVQNATQDYLIHLDADDYLFSVPDPQGDWYYGDLYIADETGELYTIWDYAPFPRDLAGAREWAWVHLTLPTPMKAAFRLEWFKSTGLQWEDWSVEYSEDTLLCLRQHEFSPEIVYGDPFYVYLPGQGGSTDMGKREAFQKDLLKYLKETA